MVADIFDRHIHDRSTNTLCNSAPIVFFTFSSSISFTTSVIAAGTSTSLSWTVVVFGVARLRLRVLSTGAFFVWASRRLGTF
jgi:hypothetical protein